jgi:hypothetical protein
MIKHLKSLILLAVLGFCALFFWDYWNHKKRLQFADLIGTKEELKRLSEYVVELEVKYIEQQELLNLATKRFKEERGALKEQIVLLSDATYVMRSYARQNNEPDYYFETGPGGQSFIYHEIELTGPDGLRGPPIGFVMIYSDGRVVSRAYNHVIQIENVVSRDPTTGRTNQITKGNYILKDRHLGSRPNKPIPGKENWADIPFPLVVDSGTTLIDPVRENERRRFYLQPKPNLGVTFSPSGISPYFGAHLAGLGFSENDLDWKFAHIGIKINNPISSSALVLAPVSYRPSRRWLGNTHIAPFFEYGKTGASGGIMINLGF